MTDRLTALDRLMSTIYEHQVGGDYIPCVDPRQSHRWISEDREQQEAAVRGCLTCPALGACKRYVDQYPETAGTWAGKPKGRPVRLPEDLR